MRRLKTSWALCLLAFALAACDSATTLESAQDLFNRSGQDIAEANCSGCHAIGHGGDSPHPDAKEFRYFSENYPVADLAEALAEGIVVGHPDMPVFQFEPDDVDKLIEYIESVQAPKEI